jgi:hypothetical protein
MEIDAAQPEQAAETSFDDKLAAKFGFADEPVTPAPESTEKSASEDGADELPEVTDDDSAPVSDDEWEIKHDGQIKRVKREEALELARQGFDYTQKTMSLAEERKLVEQHKQALVVKERLMSQVIEGAAEVRAIKAQMAPYESVDWIALAQSDPQSYPQHHANYQRLQNSLYQAQGKLHQIGQQAQAVEQATQDIDMKSAVKRMYDMVPAWKDQERFKKDRERIVSDIKERGFEEARLNGYLMDPSFIALARDAMLYREALKARSDGKNKVPSAPPVRPGAAPARASADQEKQSVIKQLHAAKDPARKKALLDEALARKFNLR